MITNGVHYDYILVVRILHWKTFYDKSIWFPSFIVVVLYRMWRNTRTFTTVTIHCYSIWPCRARTTKFYFVGHYIQSLVTSISIHWIGPIYISIFDLPIYNWTIALIIWLLAYCVVFPLLWSDQTVLHFHFIHSYSKFRALVYMCTLIIMFQRWIICNTRCKYAKKIENA